jgi:hypothetical protein
MFGLYINVVVYIPHCGWLNIIVMQTPTLEPRSMQDRSNSPLSRIDSSLSLQEYLTHTRVYPHVLPEKPSLSTLTPGANLTLPYDHDLVLAQTPFATRVFESQRPSIFFFTKRRYRRCDGVWLLLVSALHA